MYLDRSPILFATLTLFTLYGNVASAASETLFSESSEQAEFDVVLVADGLDFAWDIEPMPGGYLLLSEYNGRLRLIDEKSNTHEVFDAISDTTAQGGLRGIALHPNYETNQYLYFCYATGTMVENHTRIARAIFDGEKVSEIQTIFDADNTAQGLAHYGCRLIWLDDGTLLATMGDRRYRPEAAQDLGNHVGVAIRLNDDGSVPRDNPFVATTGVRPEIWAYGLRNVEGAARHPKTGDIWISEHGPRGGDEINILRPGRNYGWPIATFGIDYDGTVLTDTPVRPEVEPPIYYWYPSIAPSSVVIYSGDAFPKWDSDLFVTTLASQQLLRLEILDDHVIRQEELLDELHVRIRDVTVTDEGTMYVLTDTGDGRLLRLQPSQ